LDAKLYLERWLLTLKVAAGAAGLEAHVRALDFKGGERLALDARKANEAIEIRYRKRRTGPYMLAAATSAEIVGRLREVHKRVLAEHRKLLENGFRRFLRRSIGMLEALESSLYRDAEFLQRTATMLREVSGAATARPAALVRRRRTAAGRYEVLPVAAVAQAGNIHLLGLRERRLIDLDEFMPKRKSARQAEPYRPGAHDNRNAGAEGIDPLDAGSELFLVAADVLDTVMTRRTEAGLVTAADTTPPTDMSAESIANVGSIEADGLTGAGEILAEAMPAAGEMAAESVSAAGAAVEVLSSAGTATEALAETGSAVADAACAGVDCGGLDCIPL
jgi:hypothetical protein